MRRVMSYFSLARTNKFLLQKLAMICLGVTLLGALVPVFVMQHGLDNPDPIGAYMNGNLPTTTPGGVTSWEVVEAFPNLTFQDPLFFTAEPQSNRLHVGQRDGKIFYFNNDSLTSSKTTFLDISDRVAVVWDGGLMGMEFHPRFGLDSNYVYVYYCARTPNASYSTANEGFGYPGTFFNIWGRLSRFEVNPITHIADPNSELIMINKRLYNGSHRGGALLFDDEGYLYVALGDEFRYQTAQEQDDVLEGGVIRIDVDRDITRSHPPVRTLPLANSDEYSGIGYYIPNDNPWLDPAGNSFEEYYSIGHRAPHKMTYDSISGQIWSGEVGGNNREEVNIIEKGNNYGHPFREGFIVGSKNPPSVIVGNLTDPVIDFPHIETSVVIGGYVYRGNDLPYFQGKYICGGYAKDKLWAVEYDSISGTATKEFICSFTPERLSTFGVDLDGELYLLHQGNSTKIFKIAPVTAAPNAPATLSAVGAFSDLSNMTPTPGVIPYELIEPFWSDKAEKFRWLMVPNDGTHDTPAEQITFSEEGDWEFPQGAVLIKHFEMVLDENNPSVRTKLETRFLVHGADDKYYGLTYKWRPDQTDADLLSTSVIDSFTVVTSSGASRQEMWLYPSRDACLFCHNDAAKGVLGPITRQFNNEIFYPSSGRNANQLITLEHLGMFSPSLDTSAANLASILTAKNKYDTTATLEERARTYLDANCASCHRPGTGNRGVFDSRMQVPLNAQDYLYGSVSDEIGITGGKVIIPGDLDRSILFQRLNDVHSGIAMPPLAKNKIDTAGVELIKEWILNMDPQGDAEGTGLQGTYFDNSNLTNQKLTRIDTEIDFYWGTSSPDTNQIGDNSFSVRWEGEVLPLYNETYTFYTFSDDGAKLYVDGQVLVDQFNNQTPTEWSGSIALTAGQKVSITLEYMEASGVSLVELYWESESQEKEIIPTRYLYPPNAPTQNQGICLEPIANQDSGAAPITVEVEASSGLPVDLTVESGPASVSGNILTLTGGLGRVVLKASQPGDATYNPAPEIETSFYVYSQTDGQGTGLLGTYFNNSNLTSQVFQRVDNEIDFNWGSGSPDGSIGMNTYSVRWEGLIEAPYTETYEFTTNSDDGVKLWVDNTLIINEWGGQELTPHSGTISLVKGQKVPIKLEYQELNAYSIVSLSWSSPNVYPQVVPKRFLYTTHVSAYNDYAEYIGTDSTTIDVLANDYLPVAADFSTLRIVDQPWHGKAIVDASSGQIKYVGKLSQPSKDQFTYRFKDTNGLGSSVGIVYMSALGTPVISISSPSEGDTISGSSIQVDFASSGDLTDADHVELSLDGQTPINIPTLDGSHTFNNLSIGAHYVTATLIDNSNQPLGFDSASDSVNFVRDTTGNGNGNCDPLPAAWSSSTIGANSSPGEACYSNGSYELTSSGLKIGSTADGMFLAYQSLPGDGEIIARIVSIDGSNTGAQGGVMIRENTTEGSKHGAMLFSDGGNLSYKRRASTDGNTANTSIPSSLPIWVRVVRVVDKVQGYYSSDGTNWTQLGPNPTITGGPALIGLGITNDDTTGTATIQLDNVSIVGASTPQPCNTPTGFSTTSITETAAQLNWQTVSGASSYEVQYRQTGAGTWNGPFASATNSFNLTGLTSNTDYEWQVRTICPANVSSWSGAQSFTTQSVVIVIPPCDPPSGLDTTQVTTSSAQVTWSTSSGAVSYDLQYRESGTSPWTGPVNVTTNQASITGLNASTTYEWQVRTACTDSTSNWSGSANFTTKSIPPVGGCNPLVGWTSLDIGSVGLPGSVCDSTGIYKVCGSGLKIASTNDGMFFSYQNLPADGEIIGRILSIDGSSNYSNGGIMIRQSLAPNSMHSALTLGKNLALSLKKRAGTGTNTFYNVQSVSTPIWVRLSRVGDKIYGYYSSDGNTWTQLGTELTMPTGSVYVGMAISNHNNAAKATMLIDNVSITGGLNPGVCNTPTGMNTQNITGSSAQLNWIGTANSYDIRYRENGAPSWSSIQNTTNSSLTINGLTGSTDYEWQVRSICTGDSSAWSASENFTTLAPAATCDPLVGWTSLDIGSVGLPGSVCDSTGIYKVCGSGLKIASTNDGMFFSYQNLPADGEIIGRILSIDGSSNYSNGGIMIRQSLAPNSMHSALTLGKNLALSLKKRAGTGTNTFYNVQSVSTPIWVRLSRVGDKIYGYYSSDGNTWTQLGTELTMPTGSVYVGMAISNHNNAAKATMLIDNVSITGGLNPSVCNTPTGMNTQNITGSSAQLNWIGTANSYDIRYRENGAPSWSAIQNTTNSSLTINGLTGSTNYEWQVRSICTGDSSAWSASENFTTLAPAATCDPLVGWTSLDIGSVGLPGSVCDSAGIYKVCGSGLKIASTNDGMFFSYQNLPADGEIIGRILSIDGSSNYSNGGIMIRQSLAPNSMHSAMTLGKNLALSLKKRAGTGTNTFYNVQSVSTPIWVRLSRVGDKIYGYYSSDGNTWTQLGTELTMPTGSVYVGMAISNHNNAAKATMLIDNVSITGGLNPSVCNIPTGMNTQNITGSSAQLNWIGTANSYDIRYRENGAPSWSSIQNTTNSSLTINGLTGSTNYEWQVRSICTGDSSAWSASENFTTLAPAATCDPLVGWTSLDIGSVGLPGSVCDSAGIYKVCGSGLKIASTNDGMFFSYQNLPADGEIIGRILSIDGSSNYSNGGIMIRQSLAPNSMHSALTLGKNLALSLKKRAGTGTNTFYNVQSVSTPIWVRLSRVGDKIYGYYSSDGNTWTQLGTELTMPTGSVYVGMAISNHNNAAKATMLIDNVSITNGGFAPVCDVPTGLNTTNISSSDAQLNWSGTGNEYYVQYREVGMPTWGPIIQTLNQSLVISNLNDTTDYEWKVRTVCGNDLSVWSDSISFTTLAASPLACDVPASLSTTLITDTTALTNWGSVVNATSYEVRYRSAASAIWSSPISTSGAQLALGSLSSATSYFWQVRANCSGIQSAWSDSVAFTTISPPSGNCGPLAGYISLDIGAVGFPGSACDSSGIVRIEGSGNKIGSVSDELFFAYQTLSGDGEIIARVLNFNGTNSQSQGGIMIRQSLDADAAFGAMLYSPGNVYDFKRRASQGANAIATNTTVPGSDWIRLTRIGNKVRGYYSSDGITWTQLGPAPSVASGTVYVGLAISNDDNAGIANMQMDSISIINTGSKVSVNNVIDWEVIAYPNPFAKNFILQANEVTVFPVKLTLYDVSGRELETWIWEDKNNKKLAGEDLANGVYYLKIESDGDSRWLKVMKKQ